MTAVSITTETMFRTFVPPRLAEIEPEMFLTRQALPKAALAVEADTLGWDTVSAARLPVVNKTLKTSDRYPKSFKKEVQAGWSIEGDFAPWYLVRGGSGSIVFMRTPLKRASMTFPGQPELRFTDGSVTIQIKLHYLPQPPAPVPGTSGKKNGDPQYLTRNDKARSEDDPPVVIQTVSYGNAKPTELQKALFEQALRVWFNENLGLFTYVFTVVNINARAAQGQFQWLKPTYTSYAYFNGVNEDSSYFGVLNMVEGHSAQDLSHQLPPSAIPPGGNGSLLISGPMFLEQMVLPGLPKAFEGSSPKDFEIAGGGSVIRNTKTIRMHDIEVGKAGYTPYVQDFQFQVVGDEMQIHSRVKVNISPGIDAYVVSTSYYRLALVDKPDGTQTLDYVQSRPPRTDSWHTTETWVKITQAIVTTVGAVAGVAATGIKVIAQKIVAIVIIAIITGVAAVLPWLVAEVLAGKAAEVLPSIGSLVAEALGPIDWPGSSGFRLKTAQLNGSLQLGGDLQ